MSYISKNGVTISIRQRTHTCLSLTILMSEINIHTEQTVPEFLVASPEHQLSNAKISEGIMRKHLTTDTPTDRCLCLRLSLKPELASPMKPSAF